MTDRIIKRRERVTFVNRYHEFKYNGDTTRGRAFPIDENGKLIKRNDQIEGFYEEAIQDAKEGRIIDQGIKEYPRDCWEPAICKCDCGAEITLRSTWANGCHRCDREYNGSGQLLAPREQWGEETGECFA